MKLKTIHDLHIRHKTVLVRVDYNVPIVDGRIDDTLRIEASLETLRHLLAHGCKLVLISHLGEPKNGFDPKLSLKPVAEKLAELLGRPVIFLPDCVGPQVDQEIHKLQPGQIILLENLRFNPGETANELEFAKTLASYGEVYVDDAFAVLHRKHASVATVPTLLPSAAGFLVEREVKTISETIENPKRPVLGIIGGAKITTKIEVINNLLAKVDHLLIGGEMANTFLAALGTPIGKSLYEPEEKQVAQNILDKGSGHGLNIILPSDVVVAKEVDAQAEARTVGVTGVQNDDIIVDLGPDTIDTALGTIEGGTVIWNGPLGITEIEQFSQGTLRLAEGIIASGAFSLVGGGDTADFIDKSGLHDKFSFVSTGGGASLELLAGKPMPGLEALQD
jgi:phosphoglycerate kinase